MDDNTDIEIFGFFLRKKGIFVPNIVGEKREVSISGISLKNGGFRAKKAIDFVGKTVIIRSYLRERKEACFAEV